MCKPVTESRLPGLSEPIPGGIMVGWPDKLMLLFADGGLVCQEYAALLPAKYARPQ